jgi:hypothetical protein
VSSPVDFTSVPAPNYAAYVDPRLGLAVGDRLAALPREYFEGQQRARTTSLQQPVLDSNGRLTSDPRAIIAAGNQRGGLEFALQLLPFMQKQQFLDQLPPGSPQANAANPAPASAPVPASSEEINPAAGGPAGPDNIRPKRRTSEISGDGTQQNPFRPRNVAEFNQIEPGNYFVSPSGRVLPKVGANASPQQPGGPPVQVASAAPEELPASSAGPEAAAPVSPTETRVAQASTAPPSPPFQRGTPSADALVPPSYRGRALDYAAEQDRIADQFDHQAQRGEVLGFNTKAMLDQAAAARGRAQAVREALAKDTGAVLQSDLHDRELTPEMKNARAAGSGNPLTYSREQEVQKGEVEAGQKKFDVLQHQADEAQNMVQTLKLNQSLMDSPDFYSGVGEPYQLFLARMKAALKLDPNAATPQEAFKKTVSSAIIDQIRSLGGQGLGQVRVAEINVMRQAAQNEQNTPATNRILSEMQMRLATRWTIPIAEMAQAYKDGGTVKIDGRDVTFQRHGYLDSGWDKIKTQYLNDHSLFSPAELSDTRRIAPPLARGPADLKRIGWGDGMPFRTGRVLANGLPEILTHAPQAPSVPTSR